MTDHKVGHKTRRGRKRSPDPHKPHHKPAEYSRVGRLLKQRVALFLAPQISDFDLDRPRLGLSEREVASNLRPYSGVTVVTNRASGASTPSPMSHGGTP